MIHEHLGNNYITINDYAKKVFIPDHLNNTFLGFLANSKRLVTDYVDGNEVKVYDVKMLDRFYVKFNNMYFPKGYCVLSDYSNDKRFIGYVNGLKTVKVVLPLYKSNGVKIKSKKWVIYSVELLNELFKSYDNKKLP